MAKIKIILSIGKCDSQYSNGVRCPFFYTERTENAGYALDYFCEAANGRKIVGYVEWDSDVPPVPDWCPNLCKDGE